MGKKEAEHQLKAPLGLTFLSYIIKKQQENSRGCEAACALLGHHANLLKRTRSITHKKATYKQKQAIMSFC